MLPVLAKRFLKLHLKPRKTLNQSEKYQNGRFVLRSGRFLLPSRQILPRVMHFLIPCKMMLQYFAQPKLWLYLPPHCQRSKKKFLQLNARMAELVDALVSNTSELTLVPVRPRLRVLS